MEKILVKDKYTKNNTAITKKDIAIILIGFLSFFIGRVIIFKTINPMSTAFLSNFCFSGKKFYFIAFFDFLGLLTKSTQIYSSKYIISILILASINLIFGKMIKNHDILHKAISGAISSLIGGLIFSAVNNFSIYFAVLAVLEMILTFFLSYILNMGTKFFYEIRTGKSISNEELFSLAIISGSIIAGAADVYIANVPVMYFFISLILMNLSYNCGLAIGTTSAVLLSIILIFSNHCPIEAVVILSVASMFSGLASKKGKIFSAFAFALGGFASIYCLNKSYLQIELLYCVLIAGIVFVIIPNQLYFYGTPSFNIGFSNIDDYIEKFKEITSERLKNFSNSFISLSKTFSNLSEKRTTLNHKDIANLIDDVAAKVCNKCSMKSFCWEDNFYNTYQSVFGILDICEKKGYLNVNSIPDEFRVKCVNIVEFTQMINRMFEIYKTNLNWQNKMAESRELVSQQLLGVADIINNLSKELDFEFDFNDDLGSKLERELRKKGQKIENALIHKTKDNKIEIIISHEPCYGKRSCTKDIIPIVNQFLNKKMSKASYECIISKEDRKNLCKLKLIEEKKFRISTGVAKAVKNESRESGDSLTFMELNNGNYLLAISDGMGSGSRAREESAASIELFEDFMAAGFDKDMAVNMINSVLVLKSSNDSFSTLDICTINLYTGLCELVKIGAAPTFIIREEKIEVIKSSSLPVGILNSIDVDTTSKKLRDSDIIVMVTDGITDSKQNETNKENWLSELLKNHKYTNPQEMANYILESAKSNTKGRINDDMTVLVARIWE